MSSGLETVHLKPNVATHIKGKATSKPTTKGARMDPNYMKDKYFFRFFEN